MTLGNPHPGSREKLANRMNGRNNFAGEIPGTHIGIHRLPIGTGINACEVGRPMLKGPIAGAIACTPSES